MKRVFALLTLCLPAVLFASGPGGGGGSAPMASRSPHDQAVDFYNSAEHRLEGLTKMHDEMKASTDPQKVEKLKAKINKGLENAAADFERATRNDPNLYQAYSELGFTYRKLGKYTESLDAYNKALELQPGYTPAIEYRAEAMLGLNQLDEVKSAYMTLFNADRPKADILMVSMKSWVAERKTNPNGLDAAKLDDFSKWVSSRDTVAGQTSSVATASTFRSW